MINPFLPCRNDRPERFIKPPSRLSSPNTSLSSDMSSIVDFFEKYSKKTYQEGYLLSHCSGGLPTHLFAELEGSTLHLWNAGNSHEIVQPQYIQITENTVIEHEKRNEKHLFSLFFKERKPPSRMLFEAMDSTSLIRWITAFYLSIFERQKLYKLFTWKLIVPYTIITKKKRADYLQVRRAGMQWKKYWVVISTTKKRTLFSMKKKIKKTPRILFYETKNSKKPEFVVDQPSNAYAIYPESTSLIEKRTMIKLENNQESVWIMTQDIQCLKEYLFAIYDLFHLFGRPNQLLTDNKNVQSLNYAEPDPKKEGLYIHVNDVISKVELASLSSVSIQDIFTSTLKDMVDGVHTPVNVQQLYDPNKNPTNLLEKSSLVSTPESSFVETPFVRYAADSSDESENDEEGDDTDDDDSDSDNEPIGKKLQELKKLKNSSCTIPKLEAMSTPIPEREVCSTFGEFDISTDFEDLLTVPSQKQKYSLPEHASTSSASKGKRRSWQDEWKSDDLKTLDDSFDSLEPRYEITQHTSLDHYISQKLSAKEQIEYSKATGEPLIQVSSKPKNPSQNGLVNLVPQNMHRMKKDVRKTQVDKFDRERLLLENQLMQQQLMMYNMYHTQSYYYPYNYHVSPILFPSFHESHPPINQGSMRSLPQLYNSGSHSTNSYQYRRRSTKSLMDNDYHTPSSLKKKFIYTNDCTLNNE